MLPNVDSIKRFLRFPCLVLLCAGCLDAEHASPPRTRLEVSVVTEARPARLDPRFAVDAYTQRITGLVYASLLATGARGDYEPAVAKRWRWVDPVTCEFDLDPRFRFSNGLTVTARDVVATYESINDPASFSPRRGLLESLRRVEAIDETKVRFHLSAPDAAFLEAATLGLLQETEARSVDLETNRPLHGTGPYKIGTIDRDGSVHLEANPHFPDRPPSMPDLWFRVMPDPLTRTLELRRGDLDLVQSAIDPDSVDWLERESDAVTVIRGPSANLQYLGLNLRDPILGKRRVRLAISRAIDRAAIVRFLLNGQARVASGFLPPEHWAYPSLRPARRRSIHRARALLDAAGLADPDGTGPQPRFTLEYKATTEELSRRLGDVLAAQLADVGVRLDVKSFEWGTFFADVRNGNFQVYALQWVGIADPDLLRRVLHSRMAPPDGSNRAGFADERIDRWTERGRRVADPNQRAGFYRLVERRAARLLPFIPLWWPDRVVVVSRRLHGFIPHPAGDLTGLLQARVEAYPSRR